MSEQGSKNSPRRGIGRSLLRLALRCGVSIQGQLEHAPGSDRASRETVRLILRPGSTGSSRPSGVRLRAAAGVTAGGHRQLAGELLHIQSMLTLWLSLWDRAKYAAYDAGHREGRSVLDNFLPAVYGMHAGDFDRFEARLDNPFGPDYFGYKGDASGHPAVSVMFRADGVPARPVGFDSDVYFLFMPIMKPGEGTGSPRWHVGGINRLRYVVGFVDGIMGRHAAIRAEFSGREASSAPRLAPQPGRRPIRGWAARQAEGTGTDRHRCG